MEDRYYVRFKGRVLGPMSGDKTKELVRRGQITRVHELSPDGIEWRKAEDFAEFYPKKAVIQAATELVTEQKKAQPTDSAEWYVHMDGQNHGPVEESNIRMWISSGRVTTDSLVWKEGMAEWLAAELVKPQWFAGRNSSTAGMIQQNSSSEEINELYSEFPRRSGWVYLIAVTALVISVIQSITAAALLVSQFLDPASSGTTVAGRLFAGFIGGIFSIVGLLASILLLRFGNSLSAINHSPTPHNLLIASRRLSLTWLWLGVYMLMFIVFFAILLILFQVDEIRFNSSDL